MTTDGLMTTEEAVALLLGGKSCEGCGVPLPGPGEPCGECGRIPPVTGPQLARDLRSPLVVAEVEAAQAEADGYKMLDAAIEKLHEADRARIMARLQLDRDNAQAKLDQAKTAHQALVDDPELPGMRKAVEHAAAKLKTALAEQAEIARAEEIARTYEHGVKAEAKAKELLNEADAALGRYQRKHAEKAAPVLVMEGKIKTAADEVEKLKADLAKAQARLGNPGRIPYGARAIAAGMMRLLMGDKLSDAEKVLAGRTARQVCSITGALDAIVAQARAELLAEQEETAKGKVMHLRNTRDGVTATVNPHNPSAPQPFHPPAPGASPNPYPPAVTPGWAT